MKLSIDTDTGIVQMEGILKADEVLDLAHELMDIELYKKS